MGGPVPLMLKRLGLAVVAAYALAGPASAQSTAPSVIALAQHHGGSIVYSYQVRNTSDAPLRAFWIGLRAVAGGEGEAELSIAALSRSPTFWLSGDVAGAPAGWGARFTYPEESSTFALEWIEGTRFFALAPAAPREDAPVPIAGAAIPPGAVQQGFSVTVPREDLAYVTGHAAVFTEHGVVSVPIRKGDTAPPRVMLEVTRVHGPLVDGGWAILGVRYSAVDNVDPEPVTELDVVASSGSAREDIAVETANSGWTVRLRQIRGRSYVLNVTSRDASGNASTKAYTYVP